MAFSFCSFSSHSTTNFSVKFLIQYFGKSMYSKWKVLKLFFSGFISLAISNYHYLKHIPDQKVFVCGWRMNVKTFWWYVEERIRESNIQVNFLCRNRITEIYIKYILYVKKFAKLYKISMVQFLSTAFHSAGGVRWTKKLIVVTFL